jgi:hypothetical protein
MAPSLSELRLFPAEPGSSPPCVLDGCGRRMDVEWTFPPGEANEADANSLQIAREPTPGLEPGTPSLREKVSASRTYTPHNERTRKSCKQRELGVHDRDASLALVTNLVDAKWTSVHTARCGLGSRRDAGQLRCSDASAGGSESPPAGARAASLRPDPLGVSKFVENEPDRCWAHSR